jgi:hypothetical protein
LNDDKTEFMLISSRHIRDQLAPTSISVGESVVQCVSSAKNIGVTFDCHMTMEKHINNTIQIAWLNLRNIGKIRRFLSHQSTCTIVHAFITSRLDYCNSLLYGLPKCLLGKLQRIQNAAARIITGAKKFDHISPILRELHWLPVYQRINFKILLITFKVIHGMAPKYLEELITVKKPARSTRSSHGILLVPQRKRLKTYGERSLTYSAPHLWNHLPHEIRECKNLDSFKVKLKTFLFEHDM